MKLGFLFQFIYHSGANFNRTMFSLIGLDTIGLKFVPKMIDKFKEKSHFGNFRMKTTLISSLDLSLKLTLCSYGNYQNDDKHFLLCKTLSLPLHQYISSFYVKPFFSFIAKWVTYGEHYIDTHYIGMCLLKLFVT